jgi:uncharacterized membrane protein YczE
MVQLPQPLSRLTPARTVPMTRWRAPSRWRASPVTVVVLLVGLWLFGTGEALLVDAGLGVSPWTVLAQGVGLKVGIGVGFATFVVSGIVLLLWLPLRERPGLGTVSNAVVVAAALGLTVLWLPAPDALAWQLAEVLGGVAVIGLGSGLYLTTGLGPGPRDGWMTGLHRRTGIPVTLVRLAIEVVVLGLGWLLGGTVGVGTLVFALLVGAAVGYGLLLADKVGGVGRAVDSGDSPAYEA